MYFMFSGERDIKPAKRPLFEKSAVKIYQFMTGRLEFRDLPAGTNLSDLGKRIAKSDLRDDVSRIVCLMQVFTNEVNNDFKQLCKEFGYPEKKLSKIHKFCRDLSEMKKIA